MSDVTPLFLSDSNASSTDPPFRSVTSDTTIGIHFDRLKGVVQGSVVSAAVTVEASPEILANESEEIPDSLLEKMTGAEQDGIELGEFELLRAETSEIATRISERLLQSAGRSQFGGQGFADSILAIGVHGDGLWGQDRLAPAYHELIDPARIAERTGKAVIGSFPKRDIAQGGIGGPMETHGLWWLLADRSPRSGCHWRALVTLAPHVTRCTVIGPIDQHLKTQTFPSAEICVGHRFLSEIVATVSSDGAPSVDDNLVDYAKLIAKGRLIPELEEIWQATATLDADWNPLGISPLSLIYAMKNSIFASSRIEDLLATATKFIATQVAHHVRHTIPASRPIGELFVTGEGSRLADLHGHIRDHLPEIPIRSSDELFDGALYSASIAALTLLHLWQIPLPSTAPGQIPRVLGTITPGSPSNWHHVLSVMSSNAPWLLPLREAI